MPIARRPAPNAFLARRVGAIRWVESKPGPRSRKMQAEFCRAELEWALADWRRQSRDIDETATRRWGPHPSEAFRLPHEEAAARLLNAHMHVDVERWRLRELKVATKSQRRAALDDALDPAYRLAAAERAVRSLRDWRVHVARRRSAWQAFLAAARLYRCRRMAADGIESLAA